MDTSTDYTMTCKDDKVIIKWNNGNLAILCSKCRTIIKTGVDFTPDEHEVVDGKKHLPPQYCDECKSSTAVTDNLG